MPWLAFATASVFMLGTLVLLAPTISNWVTQLEQASRIADATEASVSLSEQARLDAIRDAKLYNTTLIGGAIVAANERLPLAADDPTSGELEYANLLRASDDALMGRIKIPVIGVDQPVYHGTSDAVLEVGVGHLEGTSLPVGGVGTRTVLTAHRGLATSELFTNLDRVDIGDTFTLEVFGEVLTYQVVTTEVVDPSDSRALSPVADRDLATLVTCTPLGINSHRILVTGERVLPTPADDLARAGDGPQIPGFPWWILILGCLMIAACSYVWVAGFPPRRRRRKRDDEPSEAPAIDPESH
jgi:sortase A